MDDHATLSLLTERIEARLDQLGPTLVAAYSREFVEYRSLSDTAISNDVLPLATNTIRRMLSHARGVNHPDALSLRVNADAAVRRMRQGVPLPVVLHAYRLWGQLVWAEIQACVDQSSSEELRIALTLAESVMQYVDAISSTVVQTYLEEQSGVRSTDGLLRRSILDALLLGRTTTDSDERLLDALELRSLSLEDDGDHTVVVFRSRSTHSREADHGLAVNVTRHYLTNPSGMTQDRRPGLVGLREEEVVWILESRTAADVETIMQQCGHASNELAGYVVGVGRPSSGRDGISLSYQDAHAASLLALNSDGAGVLRTYRDVLLSSIVMQDPAHTSMLQEILQPLIEHDAKADTELLETIRQYVSHRFHAAKAATALFVRPNTVLYRLKKIHELTGCDPMSLDGILLLSLAVMSHEAQTH